MSQQQEDDSQKTEEPTQKKLDEARKKGQVAKSQEVNHWFMIMSLGLMLAIFAPYTAETILDALRPFVAKPHEMATTAGAVGSLFNTVLSALFTALLLPLGIAMLAALAANFIQIGPLLSAEQLKPKLEKISLMKGMQRLFSAKSMVEFAKGIFKLSIVAAGVFITVWPERETLPQLSQLTIPELLDLLRWMSLKVIAAVLAVMLVIAALDFAFQKYQHHQQMKMSKQEVKDEHKQSEGDPMVKQRLKQLRQEKSRKRMMSAVPDSSVVVTNPTHYAVALAYQQGAMGAPRVVAKGADLIAWRIREVARENDVPIVENPPLARALHDGVDLDQEIPPEHYKAVAQIISYVMRLRGGAGARAAGGR